MQAAAERWRTADDLGPGVRSSPLPAASPDRELGDSRAASHLGGALLVGAVAVVVCAGVLRRRARDR